MSDLCEYGGYAIVVAPGGWYFRNWFCAICNGFDTPDAACLHVENTFPTPVRFYGLRVLLDTSLTTLIKEDDSMPTYAIDDMCHDSNRTGSIYDSIYVSIQWSLTYSDPIYPDYSLIRTHV